MASVDRNISSDDAREIERLLYASVWLIDHGRADEAPQTLAPDGLVHGLGPEPLNHGAFSDWAMKRHANRNRKTRHLISNTELTAIAEDRIKGMSAVVIWASDAQEEPHVTFIGDWHDIYAKNEGGRWLIRERRLVPMMGEDE